MDERQTDELIQAIKDIGFNSDVPGSQPGCLEKIAMEIGRVADALFEIARAARKAGSN